MRRKPPPVGSRERRPPGKELLDGITGSFALLAPDIPDEVPVAASSLLLDKMLSRKESSLNLLGFSQIFSLFGGFSAIARV
jgi:hypothetical protein